jgi:hypothetical protein
MRQFHDWRHTGITNGAAAGMQPIKIMAIAGDSDFRTTKRYIDLAGVVFGDEAGLLGEWYGGCGTKNRYQVARDGAEIEPSSGKTVRREVRSS